MATQTPNNDTTRKAPIEVEMEELLGTVVDLPDELLGEAVELVYGPRHDAEPDDSSSTAFVSTSRKRCARTPGAAPGTGISTPGGSSAASSCPTGPGRRSTGTRKAWPRGLSRKSSRASAMPTRTRGRTTGCSTTYLHLLLANLAVLWAGITVVRLVQDPHPDLQGEVFRARS